MLGGFNVSFNDPDLPLKGLRTLRLGPDQLVVGLSFGWGDGKSVFFSPDTACNAYRALSPSKQPRGFAFWNIAMEGIYPANGSSTSVAFASGLNSCLQVRDNGNDSLV